MTEVSVSSIMDWPSVGGLFVQTTMTLGRFRNAPRRGHLDNIERIVGYLRAHPDAAIRFRTEIPNYDGIEVPDYDWMESVYV